MHVIYLFHTTTQQTQAVESLLAWRWSTVYDAEPTSSQQWFNVLCPLEILTMTVNETINPFIWIISAFEIQNKSFE